MSNQRMSVLWLAPFVPYPPVHGGAVRIFNLIRELSRHVDISFLALSDGQPDAQSTQVLRAYCQTAEAFPRPEHTVWFPPRLAPPAVYLDDVPALRRAVQSLQESVHFDIMQVDYPSLTPYLDYRRDSGTILTELDVTFLTCFRRFRAERVWSRKLRRFAAFVSFFYYEIRHLPRYDMVITMSDHDRQVLNRWLPRLPIAVIPNGVDCNHFALPEQLPDTQSPALLFVGNFSHPPNVDAVLYFVQQVWPELSAHFPALRFLVVGYPSPEIKAVTSERVVLCGQVPDIRDFYTQSSVFVVPVRYGSGTRLKVLEVFAAGVPMVSTSLGAEGIDAQPERDYLVADSPQAFVAQIARLLQDRALAESLRRNARRLVERTYDWGILAGQQMEVYERIYQRPRSS
jgi:glycosyltransferase involved in cell wall biosynthesis